MNIERRQCLAAMGAGLLAACGNGAARRASVPQRSVARPNLYQCEGCEGALERNPASLTNHATIGSRSEPGEPLLISGRVRLVDGRTYAPNVIIYAYQTNAAGLYAGGVAGSEASRRHGRLRGWVRTGADGSYRFSTIKPAPYPREKLPAHIHFTIVEPGRRPYWIDDIVFDGEFGVTSEYRNGMTNKGGNGIVSLSRSQSGVWLARRDIVLERHPD